MLPQKIFTPPLLAHELFQLLISIKDTPLTPEAILINKQRQASIFEPTTDIKSLVQGENYLTIHYDMIVPLLIEALKKQKEQIDYIKSKL